MKYFIDFDSMEIYTINEIKTAFESVRDELENNIDFESYLENMITLGHEKEGGVVEVSEKWILIDDCTTCKAACFETELNAETKKDAIEAARDEWERLTNHDKKQRDSFYIARGVYYDGVVYYETLHDIETIK